MIPWICQGGFKGLPSEYWSGACLLVNSQCQSISVSSPTIWISKSASWSTPTIRLNHLKLKTGNIHSVRTSIKTSKWVLGLQLHRCLGPWLLPTSRTGGGSPSVDSGSIAQGTTESTLRLWSCVGTLNMLVQQLCQYEFTRMTCYIDV